MAAPIDFREWLSKQKALRTPVGSWAREVARDSSFPQDIANLDALLEYVRASPKGSAQAVAIARSAYRQYERSQAPAPRV